MNRKILCIVSILFMALAVGAEKNRTAVRYDVVDIGTLPECDTTFATDVNEEGTVVGYAYKHVPPGQGNSSLSRPYVWSKGKIIELPSLGGKYGQALTIDAKGDIGGWSDTSDYKGHPVIWQKANGYKPLAVSKLEGEVSQLLDDGTAFGHVQNGNQQRSAFRWNGKLKILGNPSDVESVINRANRKGTAVGMFIPEGGSSQSIQSPGDRHAAMWKDGKQIELQEILYGEVVKSTPKKPTISECRDISDDGVVVGYSGALARHQACVWENEKIRVLETHPSCSSEANSINKSGLIVGQTQEPTDDESWKEVACFWQEGKLTDLNSLIPADSGWGLAIAKHVNNKGMIVGIGGYGKFPSHSWRAFLLVPVKK